MANSEKDLIDFCNEIAKMTDLKITYKDKIIYFDDKIVFNDTLHNCQIFAGGMYALAAYEREGLEWLKKLREGRENDIKGFEGRK